MRISTTNVKLNNVQIVSVIGLLTQHSESTNHIRQERTSIEESLVIVNKRAMLAIAKSAFAVFTF